MNTRQSIHTTTLLLLLIQYNTSAQTLDFWRCTAEDGHTVLTMVPRDHTDARTCHPDGNWVLAGPPPPPPPNKQTNTRRETPNVYHKPTKEEIELQHMQAKIAILQRQYDSVQRRMGLPLNDWQRIGTFKGNMLLSRIGTQLDDLKFEASQLELQVR